MRRASFKQNINNNSSDPCALYYNGDMMVLPHVKAELNKSPILSSNPLDMLSSNDNNNANPNSKPSKTKNQVNHHHNTIKNMPSVDYELMIYKLKDINKIVECSLQNQLKLVDIIFNIANYLNMPSITSSMLISPRLSGSLPHITPNLNKQKKNSCIMNILKSGNLNANKGLNRPDLYIDKMVNNVDLKETMLDLGNIQNELLENLKQLNLNQIPDSKVSKSEMNEVLMKPLNSEKVMLSKHAFLDVKRSSMPVVLPSKNITHELNPNNMEFLSNSSSANDKNTNNNNNNNLVMDNGAKPDSMTPSHSLDKPFQMRPLSFLNESKRYENSTQTGEKTNKMKPIAAEATGIGVFLNKQSLGNTSSTCRDELLMLKGLNHEKKAHIDMEDIHLKLSIPKETLTSKLNIETYREGPSLHLNDKTKEDYKENDLIIMNMLRSSSREDLNTLNNTTNNTKFTKISKHLLIQKHLLGQSTNNTANENLDNGNSVHEFNNNTYQHTGNDESSSNEKSNDKFKTKNQKGNKNLGSKANHIKANQQQQQVFRGIEFKLQHTIDKKLSSSSKSNLSGKILDIKPCRDELERKDLAEESIYGNETFDNLQVNTNNNNNHASSSNITDTIYKTIHFDCTKFLPTQSGKIHSMKERLMIKDLLIESGQDNHPKAEIGEKHEIKYLICAKWWQSWKDYVNFDSQDKNTNELIELSNYPRPGQIHNFPLLKQKAIRESKEINMKVKVELKDNLLENHDFVAVNSQIFHLLKKWYECDYEIPRLLQPDPFYPGKLYLDLYPTAKANVNKTSSLKKYTQ